MPLRRSTVITLTAINAMAPGDILHDSTLKGFGARKQKDAVSYFLKTRVDGKQRWLTIGRHGQPWTPDAARKHALQLLADPSLADKKSVIDLTRTFAAVAEEYLVTHGAKLKKGTLEVQKRMMRLHLDPTFGKVQLTKISRADVEAAHAAWGKDTPRSANHALAVLSALMNWAEQRG